LVVTMQTSSGSWASGSYSITVQTDGSESSCTFVVDTSVATVSSNCTTVFVGYPDSSCDRIDGGTQVCRGLSSQSAIQLEFDAAPAQVVFTISSEGQPVASETLTPKYAVVDPNDGNCKPACYSHTASASVTISG
jgi:hypothetical protein